MKAVILAGGLGTRLSEETTLKPKPIVNGGFLKLGWQPRWSLGQCLETIADWYKAYQKSEDMKQVTLAQIKKYQQTTTEK